MLDRLESFLRSSNAFQASCDVAFGHMSSRYLLHAGRVSTADTCAAAAAFFANIREALTEYGIAVQQPSDAEMRGIIAAAGYRDGDMLDRQAFEDVYAAVLKHAVAKCSVGFAHKYGQGILLGVVAAYVAKRAVGSLPLVGWIATPLLALAPVVLVGPLLGVLGVWYRDHGDLPQPVKQLTGEVPEAVHGVLQRVLRPGGGAAARPPAAAARSPPRQQQRRQR